MYIGGRGIDIASVSIISQLDFGNKRLRKPKVQSRMDNPDRVETLDVQDTRGRQTKHNNNPQHRNLKK